MTSRLLDLKSSIIISNDGAKSVIKVLEKNVSSQRDKHTYTSIVRLMEIDDNGFIEFGNLLGVTNLTQSTLIKRLLKLIDVGVLTKSPIRAYLKDQGFNEADCKKVNHRLVCYEFIDLTLLSDEILSRFKALQPKEKNSGVLVGRASAKNIQNDLLRRNIENLPKEVRDQIINSPTTSHMSYPFAMAPLIAPADDVIFAKERPIMGDLDKVIMTNVMSPFGITNNFDIKTLNSLKLITLKYLEMLSRQKGYVLDLEESSSIEIPVYINDLCSLHGLNSSTDSFRKAVSKSLLRVFESTYLLPRGDASQRFKFLQSLTTIGDKDSSTKKPIDILSSGDDVSSLNQETVDNMIKSSYGKNFPFSCVTFRWTFDFFKNHIYNGRVTKLDAQVTRLRPTIYAIFYALYNDCKMEDSSYSFIKSNEYVLNTTLQSLIQFTWVDADDDVQKHLCKKILNDLNTMTTFSKDRVDDVQKLDDGSTYIRINLFGFIIEFTILNFANKSARATNLGSPVKITLDLNELNKNEVSGESLSIYLPTKRRRRKLISNDGVKGVLESLAGFKTRRYALTWELKGVEYLISLYNSEDELKAVYASVSELTGHSESDVKFALEHYLHRLTRFNFIDGEKMSEIMEVTRMSKNDVISYLTPRTRFLKQVSEMSDIKLEVFFGVLD